MSDHSVTQPTIHDMSYHQWGHGISIYTPRDNGYKASIMGHCQQRIAVGDHLLVKNGAHKSRYVVDEIEFFSDPRDMFKAEISFYPRIVCQDCGTEYNAMPEFCSVCHPEGA